MPGTRPITSYLPPLLDRPSTGLPVRRSSLRAGKRPSTLTWSQEASWQLPSSRPSRRAKGAWELVPAAAGARPPLPEVAGVLLLVTAASTAAAAGCWGYVMLVMGLFERWSLESEGRCERRITSDHSLSALSSMFKTCNPENPVTGARCCPASCPPTADAWACCSCCPCCSSWAGASDVMELPQRCSSCSPGSSGSRTRTCCQLSPQSLRMRARRLCRGLWPTGEVGS
mmetsp:Transcript_37017/g.82283  ORF Transcript_37017/g.82283 Transcript_37017/m.82283 type:complete len:228 (-) Transcript_37017:640-1323(-)